MPEFRGEAAGQRPDRGRFWFGVATMVVTAALIAWGGFVTSIDAGLAVPDWPTSFDSYDPFNPWPEWWTLTPVLAEHGHRLLGALVGVLTVVLGIWTWTSDNRSRVRLLGLVAILLVIVQGVLGGLRVIWISLDLAVIHACVAQLFFALLASLVLFTSRSWRVFDAFPVAHARSDARRDRSVHRLALVTAGLIFLQIVLGALLRHPGTGIDPILVLFHLLGATAVVVLAVFLYRGVRSQSVPRPVDRAANVLMGLIVLQVALGLTAYLVLLDEHGMLQPSNLQVIVNSAHLLVGGLIFSASSVLTLLVTRLDRSVRLSISNISSPAVVAAS